MESEGEHFISGSILDALRKDADQNPSFEKIYQKCFFWVRLKGGLPRDVCQDIVTDSIMEELDTLRLPTADVSEVSKRLLRTLGRNRQRAIRARNQEVELKDFNPALVTGDGIEEKIEKDHMHKVARFTKSFISLALDSLSDRDYTLIYERYQLQVYGIKPRSAEVSLETLNPGARKTALSRARIRLLNELERQLSKAEALLGEDRLVVRDALRLLRSGSVIRKSRK